MKVSKLSAAGRTDRYVHSIGQTFGMIVEGRLDGELLVGDLLEELPESIIPWSYRVLNSEDHPRYSPTLRHYGYVGELGEVEKLEEFFEKFIGTHNYKCISTMSRWQDPWRRIIDIRVSRVGSKVLVEFIGDSFVKHMIRRIIALSKAYVEGEVSLSLVEKLLDRVECVPLDKYGLGEAEKLVLINVKYPFSFIPHYKGLSRVFAYLKNSRMGGLSDVLSQILSSRLYELL